ncbi:DUF29 domain-containing protein [Endozoicomonas sp. 4G]|uniref:DUF29 domain-containing protein n=1 Tax=Endozoicomonas sp. 4G TaxID=2872754 RepID=UPI002078ACD9|nr:DUF29 domain-containing protein [Endozoicomonas sp. 4G]
MGTTNKALYESDYCLWIEQQLALLKERRFDQIDAHWLAHNLKALATEEEHQLQRRFQALLSDLLIWQYHYDFRSYPQKCRVETQRDHIRDMLEYMPGLVHRQQALFDAAYKDAVYEAAIGYAVLDTDMSKKDFPENCPWIFDQIMQEDWLP